MIIGLSHYLTLAAILFTIGIAGIILNRKNIIVILMSVELILLSVNINLVAFSTTFGDLTGQVPPSLGEADTAMREAGRQLGQGDDQGAGTSEQKAIEALQKGGREMGQAMARQFGQQPGQDGSEQDGDSDGPMGFSLRNGQDDNPGQGFQSGPPDRAKPGRDPLGRRYGQGSSGADESADVTVPEERERQRTQAIEEELRRRGADRARPQQELDYIGRLLKQF